MLFTYLDPVIYGAYWEEYAKEKLPPLCDYDGAAYLSNSSLKVSDNCKRLYAELLKPFEVLYPGNKPPQRHFLLGLLSLYCE